MDRHIVFILSLILQQCQHCIYAGEPRTHLDETQLKVKAENVDYTYRIETIQMPVDHFSFAVNDTFNMRYLVNDTWHRGRNPPIFFYTGNEGDIETFAQNTGFMWDIAPEFGALLIFAEHRYYGKSMPYGNKSYSDPKHLGYLNSQQAMADFVDLISFLRSQKKNKESAVIVFGGSYGGMLSAWIRMKYPHIVQGAIAASAPILQFTGQTACGAFSRIVTSDFKAANSECSNSIRRSWKAIRKISSNDDGRKWLSENWKLCKPLKNESDVDKLKDWLSDVYGNLAMVNYPYAANFLVPLPGNPISVVCSHLTDPKLEGKPLLLALNEAIGVYTNTTGKTKCVDIEDSTPNLGADGWPYQACTEMVMPMCSDGINDMFEPESWDFQKYSDDCYAMYKVRPQPNMACQEYGCKDLSAATDIVFSNGLLDPWSSGGVLRNVSSSAVSVLIPEGAHHLDLRGSNPKDPYSVTQTRKFHRRSIKIWIRKHREKMLLSKSSTRW